MTSYFSEGQGSALPETLITSLWSNAPAKVEERPLVLNGAE